MKRLLRDSSLVCSRNVLKLIRAPLGLFLSVMQSMLWLFLFPLSFARFEQFPEFRVLGYPSYLMFFTPSALSMTVLTVAFQSGWGMVNDIEHGMLDKFLINPIRRTSILLGRLMADGARMFLQGALVLAVALLLGARVETSLPGALLMLVVTVLFGLAWAALSNFVALSTRNPEATYMIGALLTFPMLFLSTAIMPPDLLPSWLRRLVQFNPITSVIDFSREAMNSRVDWGQLAETLTIIGGVGVVTLTCAVRAFRRVAR